MPYLGLILRLADILDLDRDRTPDSLYRTINFRSEVSLREWEKHRSVDGWVIEPTLIQFTMRCEHPEYQRAANRFMDEIDKELSAAQYMIRNFPAHVAHYKLDVPLRVDRSRIEPKDDAYIYRDLEFSLSRDEIVKLLMTNKLYGAPWLCVRELLQNSLDALRYRTALIKRDNGTQWQHGKVEMLHEVDEHGHEVVRCTDNGSGMDRSIIERFLTNVGRSYYRSPEFEQERASFKAASVDFDPCAQFGIGFMSSLMLGDHIVIRTRRDYGPTRGQGEPLIVEINGLGGIVVMRKGRDEQPVGTTVEITGRRKPHFLDEFRDQVKLLEVVEGYALACEFPVEVACTIPEIADSVTIPPTVAVPSTSIEGSDLKEYVTLEQTFSEVHPSLNGCARVSFIVDEAKQVTLANAESSWGITDQGNLRLASLKNTEGIVVESYFPRRENQICIDGILVIGHPGRDDVGERRRHNTIGYSGAPFDMGRAQYILDIRGEIKPPLTPARTLPEDRSAMRGHGPRWNYISQLINKAQGRLWEKVARQLETGLSPETFWQLAILYSETETDICWMRAGEIWSLISVPVLYETGRHVWKEISSLGLLRPVSEGEETAARKEESKKFQLLCADGGRISPYEELTKWREAHKDTLEWDLRYLAASMSTIVIREGKAMLELRAPSLPDLPPWEFIIPGGFEGVVVALPHSGEVSGYYSVHMPVRSVNREHPLVVETFRAMFLEQPSALQSFAKSAAYFLSKPDPVEVLVNTELPVTRWHKIVGSAFMDVDWRSVSPELHPPYKILLGSGQTIQVTASDFERWANAVDFKQ